MNTEPLISVIVPIFNVEKYLRNCIDSIINQTYHNLEIILVDDGSTDGCGKICDEYRSKDTRIKVIHKMNAGLGWARNSGIEVATGDYYGFVDADDLVLPQMYEFLIRIAMDVRADISCCTRMQIDENDQIPQISYDINEKLKNVVSFSGYDATKELLQSHIMFKNAVWEKLYKKEVFKNIKFRSVYAEDREVMYKLLYNAKIVSYIPLKLYCYRQREGSTMLSRWNDHKDDMVYEQDRECTNYFYNKNERELVDASIYWHFFGGIENYRRLEGQDPRFRKRLATEMKSYSGWKYLYSTNFPLRRKIEFFIFARNPALHYKICNFVRCLKGVDR